MTTEALSPQGTPISNAARQLLGERTGTEGFSHEQNAGLRRQSGGIHGILEATMFATGDRHPDRQRPQQGNNNDQHQNNQSSSDSTYKAPAGEGEYESHPSPGEGEYDRFNRTPNGQ